MLDSEGTYKINVRIRVTFDSFEILPTSAVICIQRVLHGKEIVQYLQNYKRHEIDEDHPKKFL